MFAPKIILEAEVITGALRKVKDAAMLGTYDGSENTQFYFWQCRWWVMQYECLIIFTRDAGHHTCGWWKNPQYERCWHLSISFPGGIHKKGLEKILDSLFGPDKNKLWIEPPYSKVGKQKEVWHYRLFCDENWKGIIPQGEVYSKEFTEKGWLSYSDKQYEKNKGK